MFTQGRRKACKCGGTVQYEDCPYISVDKVAAGVYRRLIFEIRPIILIGLQKLRLRPKDQNQSRLLKGNGFFSKNQLMNYGSSKKPILYILSKSIFNVKNQLNFLNRNLGLVKIKTVS